MSQLLTFDFISTDSLRQLDSERITIKVGEGDGVEEFRVAKDLLCSRSKFFANALKPDRFVEGQNRIINLPDDSPAAFEAFVYFLHTSCLGFDDWPCAGERRAYELIQCFEVFVFGQKYCLKPLSNAAMHRACSLLEFGEKDDEIDPSTLTACFMVTDEGSPMRTLISDFVVERKAMAKLGEGNAGEKKSYVVDKELEECEGWEEAVEESQKAKATLSKSDFPRSKKPSKFCDLFYLDEKPDEDVADEISYFTSWKSPMRSCEDCGYVMDPVIPQCAECSRSHCKCEGTKVVLRCEDCVVDVPNQPTETIEEEERVALLREHFASLGAA